MDPSIKEEPPVLGSIVPLSNGASASTAVQDSGKCSPTLTAEIGSVAFTDAEKDYELCPAIKAEPDEGIEMDLGEGIKIEPGEDIKTGMGEDIEIVAAENKSQTRGWNHLMNGLFRSLLNSEDPVLQHDTSNNLRTESGSCGRTLETFDAKRGGMNASALVTLLRKPVRRNERENSKPSSPSIANPTLRSLLKVEKASNLQSERLWTCDVCFKTFREQIKLVIHLKLHQQSQSVQVTESLNCDLCGELFADQENFDKHMEAHQKLSAAAEESLMVVLHTCIVCQKEFLDKDNLTEHMSMHSESGVHFCDACGEGFRTQTLLDNHQKTHSDIKDEENLTDFSDVETLTGKKCFTCDKCGAGFIDPERLRVHMVTHSNKAPHNAHACDVCNKGFCTKRSLDLHKRIHREKRPFICDVCGRNLPSLNDLKGHQITHVDNPQVCGKQFMKKRESYAPMSSRSKGTYGKDNPHSNDCKDKPFICKACGKGYATQRSLKQHLDTHTTEKPHVCEVCGRGFRLKVVLERHMATHGQGTRHFCEVCNKSFFQKSYLKVHMRLHRGERPFKCSVCKKGYVSQKALNSHSHSHSAPRSHVCEVCEKGFQDERRLIRHMRTHTAEKPYTCDSCQKSFSQKENMIKHKRQHCKGKSDI